MRVFACGGGTMTSETGRGAGEGALVSVKVESVTQTPSDCTPEHSAAGTGLRPGCRGSARACQLRGSLNVSAQRSGKRKKVTVAANVGIGFLNLKGFHLSIVAKVKVNDVCFSTVN